MLESHVLESYVPESQSPRPNLTLSQSLKASFAVRNIVYLSNMAEALDGRTLVDKASCTRVSAENNIRRRFVGTKSNAGKTTEKLVGTL